MPTKVNTLWGVEDVINLRPRCYFYPNYTAAIMGKAGTGETYRTMSIGEVDKNHPSYSHKDRVYISEKKHKEMLAEEPFYYRD